MVCEMCGRPGPTRPAFVENTKLNVCPACARFGDENKASGRSGGPGPSATIIEERLQRRERRMQTKDVYAMQSGELVDDYGSIIRNARARKGLDQEQFAASISEKRGTIAKVEANDLIPDDKLIKKIEKALDITLTEAVQTGGAISGKGGQGRMTLENFIKKE
jgi:putative transcription factor